MLSELGFVGGIELNVFANERRWEWNELSRRFFRKALESRLIKHVFGWKVHDTIFEFVGNIFQKLESVNLFAE